MEVRSANEWGSRPGIPAPTVRVVRRLRYKQDDVGWLENRYRHIRVLELGTGDMVQVMDGECDYSQLCWSWNGRRVVFKEVMREQNTALGRGQILVCDYASGEVKLLMPEWEGLAMSPQWRANDGAIAFAGYVGSPGHCPSIASPSCRHVRPVPRISDSCS